MALDDAANIGRSNVEYVTGTGANDVITIERLSGTTGMVYVSAFDDATYSQAIPVPGNLLGGITYSYSIDLTKPLVIEAGAGDDTIFLDADLGANITVRGMTGTDRLFIRANGVDTGSYTPDATTTKSIDGSASYGGTLAFPTYGTTVTLSEFEPDGNVFVDGFTTFSVLFPAGDVTLDIDSPPVGSASPAVPVKAFYGDETLVTDPATARINRMSGSITTASGTSGIVPLVFSDIHVFTLDISQGGPLSSNVVRIGTSGLVATGLNHFEVRSGGGADELVLPSVQNSALSVLFDGGAGNNTLTLEQKPQDPNVPTWKITGHNSGTVDETVQFLNVQNLNAVTVETGNNFVFLSGGVVDGNVTGGPGMDTVDFSALNLPHSSLVMQGPGTKDGHMGAIGPWTDQSGNAGVIPIGGFFDNINGFISAPAITSHPVDQVVDAGDTATFTATASHGEPSSTDVRWEISTDGINWNSGGIEFEAIIDTTSITGGVTTTLTIPTVPVSFHKKQYRVVFSNTSGAKAVTHAAKLFVNHAPEVTKDPESKTVGAGGTAKFTAKAKDGYPTPTTVQWQIHDGVDWANLMEGGIYRDVTATTPDFIGGGGGVGGGGVGGGGVVVIGPDIIGGGGGGGGTPGGVSATLTISGVPFELSGRSFRAVFSNDEHFEAPTAAAVLTVDYSSDLTSPRVTFLTPNDRASFADASQPTLTALAVDAEPFASGLASVQFQYSSDEGKTWSNVGPLQSGPGPGPFSATFPEPLPDGKYHWRVVAIDNAGNVTDSSAYTYLGSFDGPNGNYPSGSLVVDGSGNLFGTTFYGGENDSGVLFVVPAGSRNIVVLDSFSPWFDGDAKNSSSGLVRDSYGNFYGTGRARNRLTQLSDGTMVESVEPGTIFKVAAGSGTITTVAWFPTDEDGKHPVGSDPFGLTVDAYGNLYGITVDGGADEDTGSQVGSANAGHGTLFALAAGSDTIVKLADFQSEAGRDGLGGPWGPVLAPDGTLYGTASSNGAFGFGSIFKRAPGGGIVEVASFNGANGVAPFGDLIVDASGNLYGTTLYGGASGHGTVYTLSAGSSTIRTLASFDGTQGFFPGAGLVRDADGNFFGFTSGGGALGSGTVFKLAAGSNVISTVRSFAGSNGAPPLAGLVADGNGNLFGTTAGGGKFGMGTVFQLTLLDRTFSIDLPPTVVSITRADDNPTHESSVRFTVTFSQDVTGVTPGDFTLTKTGSANGTVASVTGSGDVYTVTVSNITGTGTLRLDVIADGSIRDEDSGKPLEDAFTTGEVYTIDRDPPRLTSIVRRNPTGSLTNADTVTLRATFNEDVQHVDAADFASTFGTVDAVFQIAPSIYDIRISGLESADGTLTLSLKEAATIQDLAGKDLTNKTATGTVESYELDHTQPTVVSITRASFNPTLGGSVQFTVTFSEDVQSATVNAFAFSVFTTATVGGPIDVTGVGTVYTVTVGGVGGFGIVRLDVPDGGPIHDLAGNALTPGFSAGEAYDVVRRIPQIVYVDSHWAGQFGPLVLPDPVGGLSFGDDAFADIQSAINHVAVGGTVVIFGGSYAAAVNISKPLQGIAVSTNPLVPGATTVTISGPVTLGVNTTFVMMPALAAPGSTAANLVFGSTIDAATAGAASLTVNGTMTNTFNGPVGGSRALSALNIDAGGNTVLHTGAITTSGNQTFGDPIVLEANATLTSTGNGSITVAGPVSGNFRLTVHTGGDTNYASLPEGGPGGGVMLSSATNAALADVQVVANPSPSDAPPEASFPIGFFDFTVQNLAPGGPTTVTVVLPAGVQANSYMMYGPTPDNATSHWFDFTFDGQTGATFGTDAQGRVVITLHFIDGQRGDKDLAANGEVVDPGAPTLRRNLAPQNTIPGVQHIRRNQALRFSSAHGNAIRVADADAGAKEIRVILTASRGRLRFGSTAGLRSVIGNNTGQVMLFGSQAAINAALDGLVYQPLAGYFGAAKIKVETNDLGNSGADGPRTAVSTIAVKIDNHRPILKPGVDQAKLTSYRASWMNWTSAFSVRRNDGLLRLFADSDGDPLQIILLRGPKRGTLSLGRDGSFNYRPSFGYRGSDTFVVRAFDGVAYSDPVNITITTVGPMGFMRRPWENV